jgi:ubiquinone/menaquinone biosynthesis C-methylase UbiE
VHRILPRQFTDDTTKDAYSKVAWFYNFWSWLTESSATRVVLELAKIRSGERILEVAVGTGLVFAEIVRRNTTGRSEGLDVSESMLRRAERLMKDFPNERYELRAGTAYKLPFDSHTFDLLVNNFMLDLLPEEDFVTILSEFRRVLKPDGRIVLSTMTFGRRWYNRIWHWIAARMPSLLTGCRPVTLGPYLAQAGFRSAESVYVSQNTFPSEVVTARAARRNYVER